MAIGLKIFFTFINRLGSDADKIFPFEAVLEQLRKFAKHVTFLAPILFPILYGELDDIPDIEEMIKTTEAGSFEESYPVMEPGTEIKKAYNQQVIRVFDDMARLGYF